MFVIQGSDGGAAWVGICESKDIAELGELLKEYQRGANKRPRTSIYYHYRIVYAERGE